MGWCCREKSSTDATHATPLRLQHPSKRRSKPFNEEAYKGKQMLLEGSKLKSGTQAGYFEPEFMRIFIKEGYTDQVKLRRQRKLKAAEKNLGGVFLPSHGDKKSSGLGSYYGTIGGSVKAFSGLIQTKPPFAPENRNIYTSPGKKGTGYGYAHVSIGAQYEHSPDAYTIKDTKKENYLGGPFRLNLYPRDYFDSNPYSSDKVLPPIKRVAPAKKIITAFKPTSPAKMPGGMKAGTFDLYPAHFSTLTKYLKEGPIISDHLVFRPNPGLKSRPVRSVLAANVNRVVNNMNYKSVNHVMAY
ncbi:cilia-and flagella-associated protein 96 isoform X2 [Heptranchias perlo]|uniref:cilia-and flagella-associated protein 96 isoform X2 n=1 Tax=Heptranchias perlo TaxID=212740 RepID=UPI00355988DE